jgi:hypothetical protein
MGLIIFFKKKTLNKVRIFFKKNPQVFFSLVTLRKFILELCVCWYRCVVFAKIMAKEMVPRKIHKLGSDNVEYNVQIK